MEGHVLLPLLGLCVGLVAGKQDTVLKEFDFTKFTGIWYEIAFASKMSGQGLSHKVEKMGAMVVKIEGDLLALTTTYYKEDGCVLEKAGASKGEFPGKFKVTTAAGTKDVVIVDTDYKTYAIMDVAFPVAGTVQQAMKLYSRSLNSKEEALNKFQKVALEHGYSASDIQPLKHDLTCVKTLPLPLGDFPGS